MPENIKEPTELDWCNLGFGYHKTKYRYVANYKNGSWDNGMVTEDSHILISECAGVIHYCQTCFEGLKAYNTVDNNVVVFRPDMNAKRLVDSCKRLEIPPIAEEQFIDAVKKVVTANYDSVPPYGTGAALYIRPVIFATGDVLGVKPAQEYQFRVFASPVGPYFKGGQRSIALKVSDFDRSAPNGTGHVKAGLNYAMSIHAITVAHNEGFAENLFLDSKTRTKIEETGGANFFFVTKDNKIVTPKSNTILPSITRRSLMQVAKDVLNYEVEEREVFLTELENFVECGLCGTAAVISPVKSVNDHGKEIIFENTRNGFGPVSSQLYETLTGMQLGRINAPDGWIWAINV